MLSNLNSASALFEQLNLFKNLCGLEVNSSETEVMWIGSLKSNEEKPLGINWPSEPIKAWELFFTCDQACYGKKTSSIIWIKWRNLQMFGLLLDFYGKVTIIKCTDNVMGYTYLECCLDLQLFHYSQPQQMPCNVDYPIYYKCHVHLPACLFFFFWALKLFAFIFYFQPVDLSIFLGKGGGATEVY